MQLLYTSEVIVTLYLLKAKLEEESIYCFIKNENPPLAGEIPPALAWPELWVMNDEDYPKAQQILQETLAKADSKERWVCPNCHERLEAQFNVCWKCGHSS